MSAPSAFTPALGDYVVVAGCAILPGVGKVVAFHGGRPVVQSVASPNITVTLAPWTRVVQERCEEADHPDCLASPELAVDCAHWTRSRLAARMIGTGIRLGRGVSLRYDAGD